MTFNLMIKSLLALQLISGTDTARKRWVGEATWSEPNNWNNGLPSGCDGALIEPNQILTIAAQANIAEISFGGDSAIVFDSFSEVAFGQGGNYCNDVDKSIKFYEAARDDFLSVENWEADGDLDDLDLLDIHRIPCQNDIIEVPHRQMRAELHSPVKVGAVSYGGQHLSRDQVHDWLNSPDGRNELRMLSSFVLSDVSYCKSRSGCECGNEASCNGTTCRSPLLCDYPVTTPTMCCPFCGSLMTVPVNYEKSYRQLQLELSTILSHLSIPQNLKMGIDQGKLYLVVEQRGDQSTVDVSEVVMQRLILSNYSTPQQIEVVRSSAPVIADPIHQTKVHTNSILLVVLACMVLCLITLGLVLLYIIRRKTSMFRPVQRNDSQMNACNTYETLEPDQHLYETIRISRVKSDEYYSPVTEYSPSQDKREPCLYRYPGDEQTPCCHPDNIELSSRLGMDKQNTLTSV
ncbi:uncharacterized protein LOC134818264 [Bolinopsis microptera]|uniref:uncharacterized protein LOC134818264 n=1 Tax=Bolinopsis microptera TaxID=2820187 RepID=UPI00307B0C86